MNTYRLVGILCGNIFEHYDSALFTLLSILFAKLFFPNLDNSTGLLLIFASLPITKLAKPLGAIFFGYVGDVLGKEKVLSYSLLGSGLTSLMMAFCPTYSQIGALAPLFLTTARLVQNFFISGESVSGGLTLIESSPSNKNVLSSLYGSTTVIGYSIASLLILSLNSANLLESSWRILYLLGSLTAIFSLFFKNTHQSQRTPPIIFLKNLPKILTNYKRPLLLVIIVSGFSNASFCLAIPLLNGAIPKITTFTNSQMISLSSILLIFDCILLPTIGTLTKKIPPTKLMQVTATSCLVLAIPFMLLLKQGNLFSLIFVRSSIILIGVSYSSSFYAYLISILPKEYQLTIANIGYTIGSLLLAGPTAFISLWLFLKTGWVGSLTIYWMFLGFLSFVSLSAPLKKPIHAQKTIS